MKIFTLILGDDIAYIYPDMKMAIRGEFKDEKLGKIFIIICRILIARLPKI